MLSGLILAGVVATSSGLSFSVWEPSVVASVGGVYSRGMGEPGPAPMASLRVSAEHLELTPAGFRERDALELRAEYEAVGKNVSDGKGYILRGVVEYRHGHLVLEGSATQRDGGAWAKYPVRGGAGVLIGRHTRLLFAQDFTSPDKVSSLEHRVRVSRDSLHLELRNTFYRYEQCGTGYGWAGAVLVGFELR